MSNRIKPFHIGDIVLDAQDNAWIVFAYLSDAVFVTTPLRNVYQVFHTAALTHNDRSELGTWVPINPKGPVVFEDRWDEDETGILSITVEEANAIIRGEIFQ